MNTVKSLLAGLTLLCAAVGEAQASDYYADFGGQDGMTLLVDKFVSHVLEDKRIADYFATTKIPHLKQMLALQFCEQLGGPCKYTGMDMRKAHSDLGVTDAAFNALAEDLIWAMNEQHVPIAAQNALIAKLAPMERQVVTQ